MFCHITMLSKCVYNTCNYFPIKKQSRLAKKSQFFVILQYFEFYRIDTCIFLGEEEKHIFNSQ